MDGMQISHSHSCSSHNHHASVSFDSQLGLWKEDAWNALQLRPSVAQPDNDNEGLMQADESSRQTTAADSEGQLSQALDFEDSMQEDDDRSNQQRQPCHASRTLSKWEELLQTRPQDPMAFYWRERIRWCRARNRGEENEAGVKRTAQGGEEAKLEESVDLLDRLVKRCRCNDDVGTDVGS